MNKEDIFIRLVPVIAESLSRPETEIVPTAKFTDDLGADSLDVVQMSMDIEEEFDIKFTDSELEKIVTVQDAVNLVEQCLARS
jgi:acyl carrier protein